MRITALMLILAAFCSADIMKIPEMELLKTRRVMTVIHGEVIFEAGKQAASK